MWLKRLTNSFLGIRNKEELENDLKKISIVKIITLFLTLNITFIGFVFVIVQTSSRKQWNLVALNLNGLIAWLVHLLL